MHFQEINQKILSLINKSMKWGSHNEKTNY